MHVDSKVSLTWKLLVVKGCTFGLFTAIIPFLGTRLKITKSPQNHYYIS